MLETVTAVGKPVILLLTAGSAIDLSWAEKQNNVKAILDCWYPGARGGKAVAEAVFGEFSPSGKLPVTFYQRTENLPEFTDYRMNHRTYLLYGLKMSFTVWVWALLWKGKLFRSSGK